MGGKMTATAALEKDTLNGIGAPKVITSEAQNERYIAALLALEKKSRLTVVERAYAELLTLLIETYEEEAYSMPDVPPVDILRELMEANNLKQKDLASLLGSESIVSEVLSGRRELNKHHIQKLSERFKVSPALFF
jgi:HTH-type transcriptional regulator/antitoxin HigA